MTAISSTYLDISEIIPSLSTKANTINGSLLCATLTRDAAEGSEDVVNVITASSVELPKLAPILPEASILEIVGLIELVCLDPLGCALPALPSFLTALLPLLLTLVKHIATTEAREDSLNSHVFLPLFALLHFA